jgi:peptidyl-prolyl cis-trans isomerase C
LKRDLSIAVIASILVAGICYGLATIRPDFAPNTSHRYSTVTGPQPASNEHVVMRVNGEPITEREFNAFIEQAPEDMRAFYASPAGRESLANELVKLKTLEQEGRRLGVDKEPAVANRINLTRANIIAGYTLRKIIKPPSDARIREEWEKEKKNYDTVELRHIVVAYEGSRFRSRHGVALPLEKAMEKARGITARLRAGADFIKVAQSESDDQNTANDGGNLGPVGIGALPKELDQVAMKLKPGEVSDPVASEFGIHIFKAGQHKTMPYNDQVKQGLSAVIGRKDLEATVSQLQKKAKVDLDPKFFGKASQPKRTGS